MFKKYFPFVLGLAFPSLLLFAAYAVAQVNYPPSAGLGSQSVRSTHIQNGTIVDEDVSSTAAISATKVRSGGITGLVPYSSGNGMGTSTQFLFDTSSNSLVVGSSTPSLTSTTTGSGYFAGTVQASQVEATSTLKLRGVTYTPPSADGTNGQALTTNGSGTLSWTTTELSAISTSLTALETVSAGQVVAMSSGQATTSLSQLSNGTNDTNRLNDDKWAMSFTAPSTYTQLYSATTTVKNVGGTTPSGNITIALQADSGGSPSGVSLTSGSWAHSTAPGNTDTASVTFSPLYTMTPGTTYWLVVSGGGNDDVMTVLQSSGSAFGNAKISVNGGAYSDAGYKISGGYKAQSPYLKGFVLASAAANNDRMNNVIGFSKSAGSFGDSISVDVGGISSASTTIATSTLYYLSDTNGSISTTAGTNSVRLGIGLDFNKFLLQISR